MQNASTVERTVSRHAKASLPAATPSASGLVIVGVPLSPSGDFSPHFGGSAKAGLFTVDPARRRIVQTIAVQPSLPEPCGWADWLAARGVKVFLASGMGRGAQERMSAAGIEVVTGVPVDLPALLVQAWANGTLQRGPNGCDGEHGHHHHHHRHGEHRDEDCCCGE